MVSLSFLTVSSLRAAVDGLSEARAGELLPGLRAACEEFEIITRERVAAFLAQIGHESGGFRFREEIWGPTPQQRRYERPWPLALRLGNWQKGDGFRFRGRGWIQITGRANYRRYGKLLNLPLEARPELAADPANAWRIAGAYWAQNKLNELADAGDFLAITKRINGGVNGLADRRERWLDAREALEIGKRG